MGITIESDLDFNREYKDGVSGFTGKVIAISKYQFGCVRVGLQPPVGKDGKLPEQQWFDEGSIVGIEPKNEEHGGPSPSPRMNQEPRQH